MEAIKQEEGSLEGQLASLKNQIGSLAQVVDKHNAKVASLRNDHNQVQFELNVAHPKLQECDSQISCILKERQKLQHKISEKNLERKKMEHKMKRKEMEQKDCSFRIDRLIEKHAWITSEKQLFGNASGDESTSNNQGP